MPTYEYRCPSGHEFERFYRKISDAAPGVTCPECGKIAERIMSIGGGFAFKGSGFYLTDYGKNAHRGTAPKSDGGSGDSAGAGESSSKESSSDSKESASAAKETAGSKEAAGSKETGSGAKESSTKGSDTKAASSKPAAETKSASESKSAKSGGSKKSKDK